MLSYKGKCFLALDLIIYYIVFVSIVSIILNGDLLLTIELSVLEREYGSQLSCCQI